MSELTLFNIDHQLTEAHILTFANADSTKLAVQQNQHFRWLEMNNTVQTVMDLTTPYKPVLPHMHGMLLALYYMTNPKSVLELGLGGGAIQRFFGHHFPNCTVTSVELNKQIIHYFHEHFSPNWQTDEKHQIINQDAQLAIQKQSGHDLIFIDLFSANSPPPFLNEQSFYQDCVKALSENGLLVLNLLPIAQIQTIDVEQLITTATGFAPQIYSIPHYRNRIFICGQCPLTPLPFNNKLQQICERFQLDLMNIVQIK